MRFEWRVNQPPLSPQRSGPAHTTTGSFADADEFSTIESARPKAEKNVLLAKTRAIDVLDSGALIPGSRLQTDPSQPRLEPAHPTWRYASGSRNVGRHFGWPPKTLAAPRPGPLVLCLPYNAAFSRKPLAMMSTSNCGRSPHQPSSLLEPKTFTNLTRSRMPANCHVPPLFTNARVPPFSWENRRLRCRLY
jgi:hypothetical protein